MIARRIAKIVVLILIVAPIAIFLFGWVVMYLWNNALVPVLHVSEITFWQGLGILVLSRILFGSFGGGSSSNRYYRKQKMMWDEMTPEQKERFKEKLRSHRHRWSRSSETLPGEEASGNP
jgi:hypothetical protein